MNIVILDDQEIRLNKFKQTLFNFEVRTVKTSNEAIYLIDKFHPEFIFLDHDIDDDFDKYGHTNTGLTVAKHIAKLDLQFHPVMVFVHTMNCPAAERMGAVLSEGAIKHIMCPYALIDFDKLIEYIKRVSV